MFELKTHNTVTFTGLTESKNSDTNTLGYTSSVPAKSIALPRVSIDTNMTIRDLFEKISIFHHIGVTALFASCSPFGLSDPDLRD